MKDEPILIFLKKIKKIFSPDFQEIEFTHTFHRDDISRISYAAQRGDIFVNRYGTCYRSVTLSG